MDVLELGAAACTHGGVKAVKILGALLLIDGDETDWKVITLAADDANAAKVSNLAELEAVSPGKLAEIKEWYRMYKTAEGKGENKYGSNIDSEDAKKVVLKTHEHWQNLVKSGKRTLE